MISSKKIIIANTPLKRLRGLYGRYNEIVKITRCKDIHTLFLSNEIDVAFFNEHNKVIYVERNVEPWRRVKVKQAKYVLERYSKNSKWFEVGDKLEGGEL